MICSTCNRKVEPDGDYEKLKDGSYMCDDCIDKMLNQLPWAGPRDAYLRGRPGDRQKVVSKS